MRVLTSVEEMQSCAERLRLEGRRIGFVPTMGFFHEGHLSLIRKARELSDVVVVSLFVNPIQFGAGEDFAAYPRNEERDRRLAEENGCDLFFAPAAGEMYPRGFVTYVEVENLSAALCGASRPGHFRGVATVVLKLFHMVKPHLAVFGQKDAQQCLVLQRMVRDLNLDVELIIAPIVREADGLAMSSRNTYLSPQERSDAIILYRSLLLGAEMIHQGERKTKPVIEAMAALIGTKPSARIDYITAVDAETLQSADVVRGRILVALAVRFGRARLIDNMIVACP